jgi:hypothetical protein
VSEEEVEKVVVDERGKGDVRKGERLKSTRQTPADQSIQVVNHELTGNFGPLRVGTKQGSAEDGQSPGFTSR